MRRALVVLALAGLVTAGAALASPARSTFTLRPFASGFDQPLYLASAPGKPNNLYVVEQPGRIKVLVDGKLRSGLFLDVTRLVSCCGEQGLLSVAFSPDYAKNRRLYVDYTDRNGDTRVVEYRSNGTRALPGTARQLLFVDQPYSNHNGGQLQFAPDGKLWVGMGDGGSGGDPQNHAQNVGDRLGKLLAIDVASGRVRMAHYGLRNPWRFSFDRQTGDLWVGDVGQGAWEEVDFLTRAQWPTVRNFGWNVFEGRTRFKDGDLSGSAPVVNPVAMYPHSQGCSVTGGYLYRGKAVPALRGSYVYGDYCSGTIWTARRSGGRTIVRVAPGLKVTNLSSFGEDAAGELYAVSLSGEISKVAP